MEYYSIYFTSGRKIAINMDMKVIEYRFTDYYHQYITIEADTLTDSLKENIEIQDDDCYALCSCWCKEDGTIMFNVLSIGASWEKCSKGLSDPKILGNWTMEEVQDFEARLAEPIPLMMNKNIPYIDSVEPEEDEDMYTLRSDARLDDIRNPYNADIVMASFVSEQGLEDYEVHLTGLDGLFVLGYVMDSEEHDSVKAILCGEEEFKLVVLAIGEDLSIAEEELVKKIKEMSDMFHLTYTGIQLRS